MAPVGQTCSAFAAEDAGRIDIICIKGRADFGVGTAHGEIQDFVDLNFIAGADAASAKDALVQIAMRSWYCCHPVA